MKFLSRTALKKSSGDTEKKRCKKTSFLHLFTFFTPRGLCPLDPYELLKKLKQNFSYNLIDLDDSDNIVNLRNLFNKLVACVLGCVNKRAGIIAL